MSQKPTRIYADTSVFGGVFDKEFAAASREFFDSVREGLFNLVISDVVRREVSGAPTHVRDLLSKMLRHAEIVDITDDALRLMDAYLAAEILSEKRRDDALHVALAPISGCDLIVSWNFKHIVHFQRIPLYNAVNALHGHGSVGIYSPLEVVGHGSGEEGF
jgi:predicted nucleic acid-binding protein